MYCNKNGKGRKLMSTREKTNKGKVLNYVQEQWENAKQMVHKDIKLRTVKIKVKFFS